MQIDGYDRYVMYYKNALEKLGIDMNVFRVGAYKSAVEPFTRTDMSPQDREESLAYLGAMWNGYQEEVAKARKLAPGAIAKYVDSLAAGMTAQKGDGAKLALEAGLVTGIRTSLEVERELVELVGENRDQDSYSQVGVEDYLRVVHAEAKLRGDGKPVVGVVVAAGEILDGDQPAGRPQRRRDGGGVAAGAESAVDRRLARCRPQQLDQFVEEHGGVGECHLVLTKLDARLRGHRPPPQGGPGTRSRRRGPRSPCGPRRR